MLRCPLLASVLFVPCIAAAQTVVIDNLFDRSDVPASRPLLIRISAETALAGATRVDDVMVPQTALLHIRGGPDSAGHPAANQAKKIWEFAVPMLHPGSDYEFAVTFTGSAKEDYLTSRLNEIALSPRGREVNSAAAGLNAGLAKRRGGHR